MTMFLKILKMAGKAVLWAIAAVLILFLVIIFCPVFYEIKGEKYDKTMAAAKVKALFGILRIDLGYKDGGVSTSVRIFGKRLKAFENETEEKEDENSAAKDEKAEKKPVEIPKKTEPQKNGAVKKGEQHPIPQAKKRETPTVKIEPEKRNDEPSVPADWENITAEEKEPAVRVVRLADIRKEIKEKPAQKGDIKIKYVKMRDDDGNAEEAAKKPAVGIKKTDGKNEGANAEPAQKGNNDDKKEDGKEDKKAESEEKSVSLNAEYFIKMPKDERKKLISAAVRLIKSIFRSVKPKDFYLVGKLGLSDPSLTGRIVGAAWSLNGVLNKRIEVQAVFDREIIEGETRIKGYIVPAFLMFYILRFIAVKPVRKIIILLIKGDKNGK